MRIEKISDTQVRCTLNSKDLSERHLKLSELAYGSDSAKALFREMIQKAFKECGIPADDIPLMIEAIPVSPDSLVLLITKVSDPDELDTRFSNFTSALDNGSGEEEIAEPEEVNYADEILNSVRHFSEILGPSNLFKLTKAIARSDEEHEKLIDEYLSKHPEFRSVEEDLTDDTSLTDDELRELMYTIFSDDDAEDSPQKASLAGVAGAASGRASHKHPGKSVEGSPDPAIEETFLKAFGESPFSQISKLYSFDSLDEVITLSKVIRKFYSGDNTLYKDPSNSRYYLVIKLSNQSVVEFNKVCNIISDYAHSEKITPHGFVYYEEHCQVIIKGRAVQELSKL